MAGAGYKLFNTGDVLTAAQVNTYLMEQTVMRFATTTARDTALSGVLAEGMLCYIDADNNIYKYTGSAWVNIDTTGGGSPLTTKGDLYTYSTTDARLAVGNNGETLVADSSATTGLRWTATPSASNPVLNSSFDIWQRGTSGTANSFSAGAGYNADRWQNYSTNAITVSRQTTSDTTNLPFIQYCARVQRNSGQTSTGAIYHVQNFETVNTIPFVGKTVTFSFYARKGANYSEASSNLSGVLSTGTGTDQNSLTGYTGGSSILTVTANLTTTWQRFSGTVTIGTTATEMALSLQYTPSGTAGANDWFEVTGVQIDVGNVALPYRRNSATLAGELAACQRYYYRHIDGTNQAIGVGANYSAGEIDIFIQFPVTMRGTPSLVIASGTDYYRTYFAVSTDTFDNFVINLAHSRGTFIYSTTGTAVTSGVPSYVLSNNASASIAFNAEL